MKAYLQQAKRIIKEQEYPKSICIELSLKMLTYLGQWNHKHQTRLYKVYFHVMNCLFILHFLSLMYDLYEIYNDIILFGENMCVTSGVGLVLFKKIYHNYYTAHFEDIFEKFKSYGKENDRRDTVIRNLQRKYFIEEFILVILTILLGISLVIALSGHSLFDSTLPLRAKYPFEVDSKERFVLFSMIHLVLSFFVIESIVFIDGMGGQVMSQLSLHFHVLFLDFQNIGREYSSSCYEDNSERKKCNERIKADMHALIKRHQELITFGQRINQLYQPMLMAQLACSLFMICLTAFEATLTTHDFFLFMKFAVYAVSVFIQILYWCYYGNRVSHMSSTINEALIECNWLLGDKSFRKDLMLTMMRAQKPFQFIVYGYFPISYETFISVLSRSYSLFTLFRTVSN